MSIEKQPSRAFGKGAPDFERGTGAMQIRKAQLNDSAASNNLKCLGSYSLVLKYIYASLSEMDNVPVGYSYSHLPLNQLR